MSIQTIEQTSTSTVVKHMPRWNVVLLNTDHHTFEWVMILIMNVFDKNQDEAYDLTVQIHKQGRAIALTTHKERAELFKQKVHDFGADPGSRGPVEPLPCEIEPVDD